jgi:hypothetical protein
MSDPVIAADRNRHAGLPAPLGMKIRCGHFQGNVRAPSNLMAARRLVCRRG